MALKDKGKIKMQIRRNNFKNHNRNRMQTNAIQKNNKMYIMSRYRVLCSARWDKAPIKLLIIRY